MLILLDEILTAPALRSRQLSECHLRRQLKAATTRFAYKIFHRAQRSNLAKPSLALFLSFAISEIINMKLNHKFHFNWNTSQISICDRERYRVFVNFDEFSKHGKQAYRRRSIFVWLNGYILLFSRAPKSSRPEVNHSTALIIFASA